MYSLFKQVFAMHQWQFWPILILNSLLAVAVAVVDPFAMKFLIDEAIGKGNREIFIITVVVIVAMGVGLRLGTLWLTLLSQRFKNALTDHLTRHMLSAYTKIPFHQIGTRDQGYLMSRVYEEPQKVAQEGTAFVLSLFEKVIMAVSALVVALFFSWRVTLVLFFIVPILYFLSQKFGSRITHQTREESEHEAMLRGGLTQGLGAHKTIALFGLGRVFERSIHQPMKRYLDSLYHRTKISATYGTVSGIFMALAESTVLVVAAIDVFLGNMTIGALLGFMAVFWRMMKAIMGLITEYPQYATITGYVQRMQEFEALQQDLPTTEVTHLKARQLGFTYHQRPVLSDIELDLEQGQRLLVLGPNGCGKSTLVHLLAGLLHGSGRLETVDLSRISAMLAPLGFFKAPIRRHLAPLMTQDPEYARQLLDDFGLTNSLDQDPATLSEGQKRKAYITMTLLKEADLYIFDEPLTAVDSASKPIVMDHVFQRTAGRMLIVILHGDETFYESFDRVLRFTNHQSTPEIEDRQPVTSAGGSRPIRANLGVAPC